ncbi:MAG TPA: hypothetical protein VF713_22295 [Thermoanaerobaculia bacterium]
MRRPNDLWPRIEKIVDGSTSYPPLVIAEEWERHDRRSEATVIETRCLTGNLPLVRLFVPR